MESREMGAGAGGAERGREGSGRETRETVWTVKALLDWTRDYFTRQQVEEPRLSAELLLSHVLGCDRVKLILRHGEAPAPAQRDAFRELVKRRAAHEPLGYLTGVERFFGFDFRVDRSVLIPRPETEMLVEQVLTAARPYREKSEVRSPKSEVPDAGKPAPVLRPEGMGSGVYEVPPQPDEGKPDDAKLGGLPSPARRTERTPDSGLRTPDSPAPTVTVIDLCTGSGCVACSVAKLLPAARVTATDISEAALSVARSNAERLGVADRVTFRAGDLLAAIPSDHPPADFVTANPPYIPDAEVAKLDPTVRDFEPHLALKGGADGLDFVRRIVDGVARVLKPGGTLFVEIGFDQGPAVEALLRSRGGFEGVTVLRDFQGHPRVLKARRMANGE
jgi:release factor glutamine methyltransferase